MKHLLIGLLLTTGISVRDAGNCVKYKATFETKSGQKHTGYTYIANYTPTINFKEISFWEYIKKEPLDSVYLYKNVRQLRFPFTQGPQESCIFRFDACAPEDQLIISKKNIKHATMISYGVCNTCDIKDGNYFWNGMFPTIITELTKKEIDLLQTQPVSNLYFDHGYLEFRADGYWMISYSADYPLEKINAIRDKFLKGDKELYNNNQWHVMESRYRELKKELRQKNIILFKIGYAI